LDGLERHQRSVPDLARRPLDTSASPSRVLKGGGFSGALNDDPKRVQGVGVPARAPAPRSRGAGFQPIHAAALAGDAAALRTIARDSPGDINLEDSHGWTALHWAAFADSKADVIDTLLMHGADVNRVNRAGETALKLAKRHTSRHALPQLEMNPPWILEPSSLARKRAPLMWTRPAAAGR
jgi:hypothetical protein